MFSQDANFDFVKTLSKKKYIQIAQVHTHPTEWIEHSYGDSKHAAFKINGLLSIVVPSFSEKGMLPLERCGIHRFDGEKFVRLKNKYIKKHFNITKAGKTELIDLRK